jgi:glycosyltransferase involved in cell wall biosynthesis
MKLPTVSVIMATYNHAEFVEQAINSVLGQLDVDFEFIIADDGSTDSTRQVVAAIQDERIFFFPSDVNRGACVVTNELIQRASGEFIALINSDDYWIDNLKLADQLQVMRDNPTVGACFGRARFVGRGGSVINKSELMNGGVFDQGNRSRGAWLRYFFDRGNCICHPTMLIRKSCYDVAGNYDNRLRQLPDFDMWVRLLKSYDIHVIDKELIAFRHLPGQNASAATAENYKRLLNESYFILGDFFNKIPYDVFIEGFGDLLVKEAVNDNVCMDIEKSLLYFGKNRWSSHIYNQIGLEKLYSMLGSASHRPILIEKYGLDDRAFHSMAADVGAFDQSAPEGSLSNVNGLSLIAEVKRRLVLRTPLIFRSFISRVLRRY